MESKIDELLHLSYKNGKYQKLVLFFCFLTWINSNTFNTSIELLGQRARVIDPFNSSITDELNDDLCEKIIKDTNNTYKFNRNINSIISSLNYDCDKFGISLFSISPYIGNIFGGAIYIYISNHRTYKSLIFTASTCFVIVLTCISILAPVKESVSSCDSDTFIFCDSVSITTSSIVFVITFPPPLSKVTHICFRLSSFISVFSFIAIV